MTFSAIPPFFIFHMFFFFHHPVLPVLIFLYASLIFFTRCNMLGLLNRRFPIFQSAFFLFQLHAFVCLLCMVQCEVINSMVMVIVRIGDLREQGSQEVYRYSFNGLKTTLLGDGRGVAVDPCTCYSKHNFHESSFLLHVVVIQGTHCCGLVRPSPVITSYKEKARGQGSSAVVQFFWYHFSILIVLSESHHRGGQDSRP